MGKEFLFLGNFVMSKNLVVKDNSLINASYNLDLIEQRLILLAIIQARKSKIPVTKTDKVIIMASEYAHEFGITPSGSLYRNLKNACDVLFERQFSYKEILENGEVKFSKSRWVSKVSYIPESATIELFFTDDVLQLITMLEAHFTSYELEKVADLNSKYSVRLYEILIAWRKSGKMPMIELSELRYRLGVTEKEYPILADFKKRVLDLAINEINAKTDIKVSYEQHKQGRKIIGFSFILKMKKSAKETTKSKVQTEIFAVENHEIEQPEINPIFAKISAYVTVSEQKKYEKKYSDEQIQAIIKRADEYLDDLKAKGKNANVGAIYKKAFAENWGEQKLFEKQELERQREAKKQAEKQKMEAEKAKEQKNLDDKAKMKQAIEIFEMLGDDEKEAVMNEVEKKLYAFFRERFQKNRANGKPVFDDVMAAIVLKSIIFNE